MEMQIDFGGWKITGEFTPGEPDVHYLPNGDPGYPGCSPEFEITGITGDKDGSCIELVEHIDNLIIMHHKHSGGARFDVMDQLTSECLEKIGE